MVNWASKVQSVGNSKKKTDQVHHSNKKKCQKQRKLKAKNPKYNKKCMKAMMKEVKMSSFKKNKMLRNTFKNLKIISHLRFLVMLMEVVYIIKLEVDSSTELVQILTQVCIKTLKKNKILKIKMKRC